MAQITTGIRSIFTAPKVYDAFQTLMGANGARRELVKEFIRPQVGDCIVDLGCGTAEILDHLPAGVRYWGFDISAPYIAAARTRYGARGEFLCGIVDESALRELPALDLVLALGVLHHLDDAEAANLAALARRALRPSGRFVTIDPVFASPQHPLARFLISRDRGQNVRDAEGYRRIASAGFSRVASTVRHRAWIPYTHCIMECTD